MNLLVEPWRNSSVVELILLVLHFTDTSLASAAQYKVVSQHTLLGWSYELVNINRIGCLLACSRRIYCWSVNYSGQDRLCQISKDVQEKSPFANFQQDVLFEYIEKELQNKDFIEHGVHFTSTGVTYEEAGTICSFNLGSLASYEQLYQAFQPRLENCTEGWLISGEIAFTEISGDKCTLRSSDQRSNIFPCGTYRSGYYCCRKYNQPSVAFDYIPTTQRIVRLTDNNSKRLNGSESGVCCTRFGGRLATPYEVYATAYSLSVNLCSEGWFLGGMAGDACCTWRTPSDFWSRPTGNCIALRDPTSEDFALCRIPHPDEDFDSPDPFPPHRVMHVTGVTQYTLTYQDALTRCVGYGGTLATLSQLEAAQMSGYDCCTAGWILSGEVAYPLTLYPRNGCGDSPIENWGVRSDAERYNGYCYI